MIHSKNYKNGETLTEKIVNRIIELYPTHTVPYICQEVGLQDHKVRIVVDQLRKQKRLPQKLSFEEQVKNLIK